MKAFIIALAMGLFLFSCVPEDSSARLAEGQPGIGLPSRLSSEGLAALLAEPGGTVLLLDVRTAEEYAAGHIPGAILAPYDALAVGFTEADKNRPIVVYCRSGNRSGIAMKTLRSMGYANLSDFGGISNWKGGLE